MMDRCVLPRDFVGFLVLFVEILEKGGGDFWRGTEKSVDCWSRLVPKCGFKAPRHCAKVLRLSGPATVQQNLQYASVFVFLYSRKFYSAPRFLWTHNWS